MAFNGLIVCCAVLICCNVYAVVDGCTRGFMELDLLNRRAEKIPGGIAGEGTGGGLDNEFRLLPDESFSCSGIMTGLLLVGTVRTDGERGEYPELQIWRNAGDNTYTRQGRECIKLSEAVFSPDGVLQYNLTTPIRYQSGDVLGVYQPRQLDSVVRVYFDSNTSTSYQIEGYPESNSLTIPSATFTDNEQILISPMSDSPRCTGNFLSRSTLKQGALNVNINNVRRGNSQRLFPDITFTCNGFITKWIVGVKNNYQSSEPELQIWQKIDGVRYSKAKSSNIPKITPTGNVIEFNPYPPLEFKKGDILGVYQPYYNYSNLVVYYQEHDGPTNYKYHLFGGYIQPDDQYDYPLVTVEISTDATTATPSMSSVIPGTSSETLIATITHSLLLSTETLMQTYSSPSPTISNIITSTNASLFSTLYSSLSVTKTPSATSSITLSTMNTATTADILTVNTPILNTSITMHVIETSTDKTHVSLSSSNVMATSLDAQLNTTSAMRPDVKTTILPTSSISAATVSSSINTMTNVPPNNIITSLLSANIKMTASSSTSESVMPVSTSTKGMVLTITSLSSSLSTLKISTSTKKAIENTQSTSPAVQSNIDSFGSKPTTGERYQWHSGTAIDSTTTPSLSHTQLAVQASAITATIAATVIAVVITSTVLTVIGLTVTLIIIKRRPSKQQENVPHDVASSNTHINEQPTLLELHNTLYACTPVHTPQQAAPYEQPVRTRQQLQGPVAMNEQNTREIAVSTQVHEN